MNIVKTYRNRTGGLYNRDLAYLLHIVTLLLNDCLIVPVSVLVIHKDVIISEQN